MWWEHEDQKKSNLMPEWDQDNSSDPKLKQLQLFNGFEETIK